jgi:hypothetical protein
MADRLELRAVSFRISETTPNVTLSVKRILGGESIFVKLRDAFSGDINPTDHLRHLQVSPPAPKDSVCIAGIKGSQATRHCAQARIGRQPKIISYHVRM